MAWHKSATWALNIFHWFFYVSMSAILFWIFTAFPEQILAVSVQPIALDSSLMAERLHYSISDYDQFAGVKAGIAAPGKLDEVLTLLPSEKRHAIRVQRDGDLYFPSKLQKEFYEDAAPLVPIRYKGFDYAFRYTDLTGRPVKVTVSQVFPQFYEKIYLG